MNHDEHYRKIEAHGVEPIVAMESVACLGLPQEYRSIAVRNLNLALAVKHITRCGEKDGQEASTEIDKAQNYLTRAKTGRWRQVTIANSRRQSLVGRRVVWAKNPDKPVGVILAEDGFVEWFSIEFDGGEVRTLHVSVLEFADGA